MKRIACNISPIKDLAEPTPTFEDLCAEDQKLIKLGLCLADLATMLGKQDTEKKD